jgi:hypothetical protein
MLQYVMNAADIANREKTSGDLKLKLLGAAKVDIVLGVMTDLQRGFTQ